MEEEKLDIAGTMGEVEAMYDEIDKALDKIDEGGDPDVIMADFLQTRRIISQIKTRTETTLEKLDEKIKTYMVMNGIETEKFEYDGWRLKITGGTNVYFGEAKIREVLMGLELNPEETTTSWGRPRARRSTITWTAGK